MIFLLSIKNKIQLINYFKIIFYLIVYVSFFYSILRNTFNILRNNNIITLFFFYIM